MTDIPERFGLVADIGGTNCRFALVDLDDDAGRPLHEIKYKVRDYEHVTDAAEVYFKEIGVERAPVRGCFAVAGPAYDNKIKFTNSNWAFSGDEVAQKLGAEAVTLLNDFSAIALSLPHLNEETDLIRIGAPVPGSANSLGNMVMGVLGAGTGLGVSGLVRSGERDIPLDTEGGHVAFAPLSDEEGAVNRIIRKRYGRTSNERILSGQGLKELFEALSEVRGGLRTVHNPEEVSRLAKEDRDPLALDALAMFYGILGSVAGDIALTIGALGGIFIAGGIAYETLEEFRTSPFRIRFEDKGRFKNYMQRIPTHVITHKCPGNIGCAMRLRAEMKGLA